MLIPIYFGQDIGACQSNAITFFVGSFDSHFINFKYTDLYNKTLLRNYKEQLALFIFITKFKKKNKKTKDEYT